jgi:penicillin-binding protein 1C
MLAYDGMTPLPDVYEYESSSVVLDRGGDVLNARLSGDDEWCIPVSLDKMGTWTGIVAVQLEDKRFYRHSGVDFIAICRSLFYNVRARRVVTGASTITTQLIRIADPRPRTYSVKFSEFWRAARLEAKLSKSEILELYLNRAPFGGNVRGIEAASRAYFNKSAQYLSLSESALLISILRAPSRFRPDRHPENAAMLRDRSLALLRERGAISVEALETAMRETLPGRKYAFPRRAEMASAHMARRGEGAFVRSAIDGPLQLVLEKNIENALGSYPPQITAAAIVVDNGTGEVLAYIGNGRFGSGLPGSEVDCGNAPRSPGSALKPFIYAAAFEKGILTPASLLADTPIAFHGSAPRNFDLSYRGPVSARIGLASSLNAPAVRVLRRLGYANAIDVLRRFGFAHIERDAAHYADALVLGGCEVTLLELASAYRTLARMGIYEPLKWTFGASSSGRSSVSSGACYMTLDILKDTGRLLPLYRDIFAEEKRVIAFKTGTSHGLRDAWCIGVSKGYTVGVWLGTPEGRSAEQLIGLEAAAPIVMQIFRELPDKGDASFPMPESIYERSVCALSGMLPTENCANRTRDMAIRGVSPVGLCELHRNADGRIRVVWPPELSNWFDSTDENLIPLQSIRITKPLSRARYRLGKEDQKMSLLLSAEGPLPHYWFLDGEFLGEDRAGDGIFADVQRGSHTVSVLSRGQTDRLTFDVLDSSYQFEINNSLLTAN